MDLEIKRFFLPLILVLSGLAQAQSKEALQKDISDDLSYKHITYGIETKKSQISIYQIEFKDCVMSYPVFIKKENKTERYTVRILLSGIDKITMARSENGYNVINFTTGGKSIIREYPDGTLLHEVKQSIPLKTSNPKALESFKQLKAACGGKPK
ncbi:hypothetical protein HYN56_19900 [Flavobacterium crocinum]|uniref:DUF4251 domain-containing protein n=1 Tax=Flavobacterium crocinum TaxID=2183896 RepID=A0A2S1YQM5_9FLAO|nr:hypothetical protein [Flavobacterium crocinum]AWK06366.1 hypothetical protein HYN56_19900 [Flavobacterium crocinum]